MMKQSTIVAIVLGVLVVISALQAVQLTQLKSHISDGTLSIGSGMAAAPAAQGGVAKRSQALPPSLQDLPQMVGGC